MAKTYQKESSPSSVCNSPAKAKRVTKKDTLLHLLKRPTGAGIAEMQKATGWQAHSVRGLSAVTVSKIADIKLDSEKHDKGTRRYRTEARPGAK